VIAPATLPAPAQALVARIVALLDEARRYELDHLDAGEDGYLLRATRERYLNDTLAAYERIPERARDLPDPRTGISPTEALLAALATLQRATEQRLARAIGAARSALNVNRRFLEQRFGADDDWPATLAPVTAEWRAQLVARRFLRGALDDRRPRALLNALADRLYHAFPQLARVDRGLLDWGPAQRVEITVPVGNDRMRYTVALDARGELAAARSTLAPCGIVGIESLSLTDWLRVLFVDLAAYASGSVVTEEQFDSLLSRAQA